MAPGDTSRLFVAVDPPAEAVAHLGLLVDSLLVNQADDGSRVARLTAREGWHVTLAFLGAVPTWQTGDATRALIRAVRPAPGPSDGVPGGPQVCFAGGGTFGREGFAILWAGLGGDVPGLCRLAEAVRRELGRAGMSFDARAFRPHLTISRPGARVAPDLVAADVATLNTYEGPLWTVDAVHLVASDWVDTPAGRSPHYTRISSTPLV